MRSSALTFPKRLIAAIAMIAGSGLAPSAHAQTLMQLLNPDNAVDWSSGEGFVDACDQRWVVAKLKEKFDYKVRAYTDRPGLAIKSLDGIKLVRARPRDETHLVGRQYCEADAVMSDRQVRKIYYLLEYPWGYAGQLTRIEFCVQGLDPWHVYGQACSTVR